MSIRDRFRLYVRHGTFKSLERDLEQPPVKRVERGPIVLPPNTPPTRLKVEPELTGELELKAEEKGENAQNDEIEVPNEQANHFLEDHQSLLTQGPRLD